MPSESPPYEPRCPDDALAAGCADDARGAPWNVKSHGRGCLSRTFCTSAHFHDHSGRSFLDSATSRQPLVTPAAAGERRDQNENRAGSASKRNGVRAAV